MRRPSPLAIPAACPDSDGGSKMPKPRVDQVRRDLWTPDGPVAVDSKDRHPLRPIEVQALSVLDGMANKWPQLCLLCRRCDSPILGKNNDTTRSLTMACRCTEWVFQR